MPVPLKEDTEVTSWFVFFLNKIIPKKCFCKISEHEEHFIQFVTNPMLLYNSTNVKKDSLNKD